MVKPLSAQGFEHQTLSTRHIFITGPADIFVVLTWFFQEKF